MTDELFQCPVCGLHYEDQQTAQQCETYCTEHNGCSLEITKLSVERKRATEQQAVNTTDTQTDANANK